LVVGGTPAGANESLLFVEGGGGEIRFADLQEHALDMKAREFGEAGLQQSGRPASATVSRSDGQIEDFAFVGGQGPSYEKAEDGAVGLDDPCGMFGAAIELLVSGERPSGGLRRLSDDLLDCLGVRRLKAANNSTYFAACFAMRSSTHQGGPFTEARPTASFACLGPGGMRRNEVFSDCSAHQVGRQQTLR
jgi:hypothetical protein